MAIRSARARSRSNLTRHAGSRSGRRVLISCEGSETEPGYLGALRRELKLGAMVVITGGGKPSGVVNEAARRCRRARNEGRPFDAVWCVFDRDQHDDFEHALAEAQRQRMQAIPSVPCFELWLLLHFKYTARPFASYQEIRPVLRTHVPDYDKTADWNALLARRAAARDHAVRLLTESVDSTPHPCPSTHVHELVSFLESLRPGPG